MPLLPYYGTNADLAALQNAVGNEYQVMVAQMSYEWRVAVYYVMSRSNRELYLDAMLKAYKAGVLGLIDPNQVLAGSEHFVSLVDQLSAQ